MSELLTPSEIGSRAEAAVAKALIRAGKTVLTPLFAPHARYDLVFEDEDGFHRVQCKAGRIIGDVVTFHACSNTKNTPKRYQGETEFFGVYCQERDEVYLVLVDDMPLRPSLRLGPTQNNQRKGIRWARDYRLSSEERPCYRPSPTLSTATRRSVFVSRCRLR